MKPFQGRAEVGGAGTRKSQGEHLKKTKKKKEKRNKKSKMKQCEDNKKPDECEGSGRTTAASWSSVSAALPNSTARAEPTGPIAKKRKKSGKKKRVVQSATMKLNHSTPGPNRGGAAGPAEEPCQAGDEEEEELEGVFVGDALYLRGKTSAFVFSSLRGDNGELIRVGRWADGAVELDPKPMQPTRPVGEATATDATGCTGSNASGAYPFEVDADDHCETPPEAFDHIAPVLAEYAKQCRLTRPELGLWDPYYCAGTSAKHLATLGFVTCHHRKEDFYAVVDRQAAPSHAVVVTNPPFSGEHIPRFLRIVQNSGKPWCMLAPNWVYTKPYFAELPFGVFFVVPEKRYRFLPPQGARAAKASDTHKRTSPFPCFWFCGGFPPGLVTNILSKVIPGALVARTTAQLPFHALADYDPRRKKIRSAMKRKRKRGVDN